MKRKCNIAKFILSPKLIDQMTKKKYYLKINKIKYAELAGGIVWLFALVFTVLNFEKLDTISLQVIGVIMILLLIMLAAISV